MTAAPQEPSFGNTIPADAAAIRIAAEEDRESVIALTRQLIRIPTRGGLDPYDDAIELVASWARQRDLDARVLTDEATGTPLAVVCDVAGTHPGPRYVLDACLDTAPFGDASAWTHEPTSGLVADGWLHGRGSADSKVAIAIFLHIAAQLRSRAGRMHGSLTLLFDADEHTGNFGGAKRYFAGPDAPTDVAGVMIGYPGNDRIVTGGRGFLRAEVTLHGTAGHTGSDRAVTHNAIEKASQLVAALSERQTPAAVDPNLGRAPRVSATRISGGESYSIVPDRCTVSVDVRLTTTFAREHAERLLGEVTEQVDASWPSTPATTIAMRDSWPAYALSPSAPIKLALERAASEAFNRPIRAEVAGPSNIGNYLAKLGLDATAGLGVTYRGLHGSNEAIDVSTIPPVHAAYHSAVANLLGPRTDADPGTSEY